LDDRGQEILPGADQLVPSQFKYPGQSGRRCDETIAARTSRRSLPGSTKRERAAKPPFRQCASYWDFGPRIVLQRLLAAPELVARTWATAKREGNDEITEREVTVLLADFATVWNELFPAEQARIVQLLVEQDDVQEDALEVRIRAEGLVSLVGELRPQGDRTAA
jgi:hypothetical protein